MNDLAQPSTPQPLIRPLRGHLLPLGEGVARHGPSRYSFSTDSLTLFGLFAVTAMLAFYAVEQRSPWFILAFAGACGLASVYGFLSGAWPFGVVEAVWALVALRRWYTTR